MSHTSIHQTAIIDIDYRALTLNDFWNKSSSAREIIENWLKSKGFEVSIGTKKEGSNSEKIHDPLDPCGIKVIGNVYEEGAEMPIMARDKHGVYSITIITKKKRYAGVGNVDEYRIEIRGELPDPNHVKRLEKLIHRVFYSKDSKSNNLRESSRKLANLIHERRIEEYFVSQFV